MSLIVDSVAAKLTLLSSLDLLSNLLYVCSGTHYIAIDPVLVRMILATIAPSLVLSDGFGKAGQGSTNGTNDPELQSAGG